MLSVELRKKFTSENFEVIIDKYWKKSFKDLNIIFDLSILEWIANEQIAFLIGWIRTLLEDKRNVEIILPKFSDDKAVNNKRFNVTKKLLIDWNIQEVLNGDGYIKRSISYISGDIRTNHLNPSKESKFNSISHRLYDSLTFDRDFDRLHSEDFKELNEYIKNTLTEIDESDYFSSAHINYSLLKELISNSYQHAYNDDDTQYKPIFLSLDFNIKIDEKYNNLKELLKDRYNERPLEEREYFIEKNNFVNQNFIEFSFFDFGNSIPSTLKDSFNREKADDIKNELNSISSNQSLDTQILEYAFLVWSSSYEIKKSLEIHNYIPRGLFIVKDIVKRYGGMLIVRSGKGKIVYDLRNDTEVIRFRKPEEESKIEVGFPGTIITFILPTQNTTITHVKPDVNNIVYNLYKKEKIQLLTLIEKSKPLEIGKGKSNEFLQEFFGELCKILRKNHKEKSIIYFDFAGTTKDTNDIIEKLIYFVSYSPFISKNHKVIFYNIIDINLDLDKHSMQSKGFEAYPIPYLLPNFKVSYIGIEASQSEKIVNEIWITKTQKINSEQKSLLELVAKEILKLNSETIGDEIANKGIRFKSLIDGKDDFNTVKIDITDTKERFLISSNTYSSIYLTFIEKTYILSYRKLIATYLFSIYYYNKYLQSNKTISELWSEQDNISAVLSVTLGGELVGKELISLFKSFGYFKPTQKVRAISLTTYFDFKNDDTYDDVKPTDKILIINDFISTGNFTETLIYKISAKTSENKVASVNSILSIVDCREDNDKKKWNDKPESKFLSIIDFPIKKQKTPHEDGYSLIYVNPVTNNPVSIREKSNNTVLINNVDFLQEYRTFLKDDFFIIGNFKLNSALHTHFIKTRDIFIQEEIFSSFIDKLIDKLQETPEGSFYDEMKEIKVRLSKYFDKNIAKFEEKVRELEILFNSNTKQTSILGSNSNVKNTKNLNAKNKHFDYIFYPFSSTIEDLESNRLFKNKKLELKLGNYEVYAMPRILTPRGWRFSYPPKFLTLKSMANPLNILILDDGSCSGHTIEQMILALKDINISEVIIFSFVSRLEDFRLDFLTKIRQIKIGEKLIPIRVYYGTHFNIHSHTKGSHPLDVLKSDIEKMREIYKDELPTYLESLFKKLKLEYQNPYNYYEKKEDKSHIWFNNFPKSLNGHSISKKAAYLIRSYLGQYSTFKYTKYDTQKDKILDQSIVEYMKDEINGRIYATLSTLYHEPDLIKTLERTHPDVKIFLYEKVIKILVDGNTNVNDNFIFIYLLYMFDKESFFKKDDIKKIIIEKLPTIPESKDIFNLIGFLLSKEILFKKHDPIKSLAIQFIIDIFLRCRDSIGVRNTDHITYNYFRDFHNKLVQFNLTANDKEIQMINKLRRFYTHEDKHKISHSYLQKYNSLDILKFKFDDKNSLFLKELYDWYDSMTISFIDDLIDIIPELKRHPTKFDKNTVIKLSQNIKDFKKIINDILTNNNIEDSFNFSDFKELAETFKEDILSSESTFFKFIKTTKVNLLEIWNETLLNYNQNQRIPLIISETLDPKTLNVTFDSFTLQNVFRDIIENKHKYAVTATANYSLEINHNLNKIIIRFEQNTKFIRPTDSSGITDIKAKLSEYFASHHILNKDPYIFTIHFPKID